MSQKKTEKVEIKRGRGNQSNSASWKAAYNEKYGKYVVELCLSSAAGCWCSDYVVSREIFDQLGAFDNDDYKTERLIRKKGKELYRYENERNYIEPVELVFDKNYEKLCSVLNEDY